MKKYVLFPFLLILVFTLVINTTPSVGQAESQIEKIQRQIKELKKKQKEAEKRAAEAQMELNQVSQQKKAVQYDIMQLDLKMNETQARIDQLDKDINNKEEELNQAAAELQAAETRVAERDSLLKTRVKMMYETGKISYLEVLLGSKSFSDFLDRLDSLKLIVDQDVNILAANKRDRDTIAEKKAEIEVKLNELEGMLAEAQSLKESYRQQLKTKTVVAAQLEQKERELGEVDREEEERVMAIAREIAEKMKELEKLYYKGGKLLWPAPGTTRITSGFGYRVDPFTGKPAGHNGLDIGANPPGTYGSPIVAAESGVVITAAYLRGYGNTVIINHGGGIWTLYGHNQKLLVKEGQEVKRGDTIALMGSTGRSTGPHVHFTVYKNQVPVDPMPYLK